jgi:hypothetical protein
MPVYGHRDRPVQAHPDRVAPLGIDDVPGAFIRVRRKPMQTLVQVTNCGLVEIDVDHCQARLFVRGAVESLGADCVEKELRPEHLEALSKLLDQAGIRANPREFKRYGSARKLYNFNVDHAAAY